MITGIGILRGIENGFLGTRNRKKRKTIGLKNGIQAYLRPRAACNFRAWLNWEVRHEPFLHSSHSSPFINSQFYAHTGDMHSLLQSGTKTNKKNIKRKERVITDYLVIEIRIVFGSIRMSSRFKNKEGFLRSTGINNYNQLLGMR